MLTNKYDVNKSAFEELSIFPSILQSLRNRLKEEI